MKYVLYENYGKTDESRKQITDDSFKAASLFSTSIHSLDYFTVPCV